MTATAAARAQAGRAVFTETVPARLEARPRVIQTIIDLCRRYRLSSDVEHSLVSALGEAFNNVCMHAYRDRAGDVAIEVELEAERVRVRLRDRGASFDPATVSAPDLAALPEGGLGLFIMRAAMDDVRWYRQDEENVVALEKRLPRSSV
jgi:serine/threonine-protein kinase RsbW